MKPYSYYKANLDSNDLVRQCIFYGIHWMNDGEFKNMGELSKETTRVVGLTVQGLKIDPIYKEHIYTTADGNVLTYDPSRKVWSDGQATYPTRWVFLDIADRLEETL